MLLSRIINVVILIVSVVVATHFRGGTMRYHVTDLKNCTVNLYAEEVMESGYQEFQKTCKKGVPNLYEMNIQCNACTKKGVNISLPCVNWRPDDKVSTMHGDGSVMLACDKPALMRYASCCWISEIKLEQDQHYEMVLEIVNLMRKNGEYNRSPTVFVPPVLRVGANKTESFRVFVSDPDGDEVRCKQPDPQRDCYRCTWIDNLNAKKKSYVTINEDCTFATNFPKGENNYYRMVITLEERDKDDNERILSRSTVLLLLLPMHLPCPERATTSVEIKPNHRVFQPGVKYELIATSKAACDKVNISKIIFSLKPDGAKMTLPTLVGDTLRQGMEFEASEKLCTDMIPICTYSLDNHDIQGKPICTKFECRGYNTLTELDANRKKRIAAIASGCLGLLALMGLVLGLMGWKMHNRKNGDSESTMTSEDDEESSETSSQSQTNPPPAAKVARSVAMSSVDLDD